MDDDRRAVFDYHGDVDGGEAIGTVGIIVVDGRCSWIVNGEAILTSRHPIVVARCRHLIDRLGRVPVEAEHPFEHAFEVTGPFVD